MIVSLYARGACVLAFASLTGLSAAGTALAGTAAPLSQRNTLFSSLPGADDAAGARAGFEAPAATATSAPAGAASNAAAIMQSLDGPPRGSASWQALGPSVGTVPGPVTYTGASSVVSGRITGLAMAPNCVPGRCVVLVAAAGGGVWRTRDALAATPQWQSVSQGLPTTAIGSIAFDPNDSSGQTVYVGTGEANGSSDSEAGLGLFKSDDQGDSWDPVAGSQAVARDRAIAAVAIDPADAQHILIGTAVARHGMAGAYGGRFTPPAAPPIGLYESRDGGEHFNLRFARAADAVNPSSANGSDFFRGGVTHIEAYRPAGRDSAATQFYFSVSSYGLYRTSDSGVEQVFVSSAGGSALASSMARTEFTLAPMGKRLRIYLGDTDASGVADLYRVDNANLPAQALSAAGGWVRLSNPASGSPGYGVYSFCSSQCSYDMVIASPPGRPDTVWVGGQMHYDDIFRFPAYSNGRAVMRSTDGGVTFTDMTNDTAQPPQGMHPDQHAIVFAPGAQEIALIGSDGGLVRNDGSFVDTSAYCGAAPNPANPDPNYRNLLGTQLANCRHWLSAVPKALYALNTGITSLQFQGLSFDPANPRGSLLAGTQDNGSWIFDGSTWIEAVGGDGGQSAINPLGSKIHTYTGAVGDIQFSGADPVLGWDIWSVPSYQSPSSEAASFYLPLIADGRAPGTWFVGLQHVWRSTDDLGGQAYMDLHCNEFAGDLAAPCGDWLPLAGPDGAGNPGDLTGAVYGSDKTGGWVSRVVQAEARARGAARTSTLWAATRRGRLFVSTNANAASEADVVFTRIDGAAQPTRFVSGIAVDPVNPLRAIVTFTGYDAYTPTTVGHVFEVIFNPATGSASWKDLTANLGDQPILGVAYDPDSGRIYVSTDYGVAVRLPSGDGEWLAAAKGMPPVAVYDLAIDSFTRTLYAVSHGRGIFRLDL